MLKQFLLIGIPIIFIISCSKELEKAEVNIDEIFEKNGQFYAKDTNELFTATSDIEGNFENVSFINNYTHSYDINQMIL